MRARAVPTLEFEMTKQKDLKALVRARMEKTGESYQASWSHITGNAGVPGAEQGGDDAGEEQGSTSVGEEGEGPEKILDDNGDPIGFRVERKPWTPWVIEVYEDAESTATTDPFQYDPVFRTGWKTIDDNTKSSECEMFSLLTKGVEDMHLQVRIWKNGDVQVWHCINATVCVLKAKKLVKVYLLGEGH